MKLIARLLIALVLATGSASAFAADAAAPAADAPKPNPEKEQKAKGADKKDVGARKSDGEKKVGSQAVKGHVKK